MFTTTSSLNSCSNLNETSVSEVMETHVVPSKFALLFSKLKKSNLNSYRKSLNVYQEFTLSQILKNDLRFHVFLKGEIIYVYGSSTSGKSTFSQKLVELVPDYKLLTTRDLKTNYMAKIISEICPKEFDRVIQGIHIDLLLLYLYDDSHKSPQDIVQKSDDLNFMSALEFIKSKIDLIEKRFNPIEQLHYVYEQVFILAKQRKKLVFDNVDALSFLGFMSLNNIHCQVRFLLLYCPPATLLDRVVKRNEVAMNHDKHNLRSPMRPLETFLHLYQNSKDSNFIDQVERKTLLQIFNTAHSLCKDIDDKNPLGLLSLAEVLDFVDSTFGLDTTINLQSKFPYNLCLNTSLYTPNDLAAQVQDIIRFKAVCPN